MAGKKTAQHLEKKYSKPHEVWPFVITAALACAGMFAECYLRGYGKRISLYDSLMIGLGLLIVWLQWVKLYRQERLPYNNSEHPLRFWLCVCIALLAMLGMCSVSEVLLWPITAVYLMLALFGNSSLGIVGGTVMLAIPALVQSIPLDQFLLQFLAGVFAAVIFQKYGGEVKVIKPAGKALLGLALCLSAMNFMHGGLDDKMVWIHTFYSLLLTAFLFLLICFCFMRKVFYYNQEIYKRILDPEEDLLSEFRENNKLDYLKSVHVVYFCEAIANRLGWSVDVMKCAGYYYKWGSELPELVKKERFPKRSAKVLMDYFNNEVADIPQVKYKETAALVCADIVLTSMIYLVNTDTKLPNYDVVIEAIFERMHRKGTFDRCEISGKDLYAIKKIFKEETYYYDSLRRK